MNMATGGFGTEVTVKTDPKLKQQLGGAAYIITGQITERESHLRCFQIMHTLLYIRVFFLSYADHCPKMHVMCEFGKTTPEKHLMV